MTPLASMPRRKSAGVLSARRVVLRRRDSGYLLLELILAMTVFVVAIAGLAEASKIGTRHLAALNRGNEVRLALRSFLEEVRRKPLAEMGQSIEDQRLGVAFRSEVEEIESVRTANGNLLRDLYVLRVVATDLTGTDEVEESAEVWVYKPRTEQRR